MGGFTSLQRIRADRERRERHFPGLPEAAWDMLVDLALHTAAGKRVSVTSACLAAFVPATTGLRHVGLLVGEDLVERHLDPCDARRTWLGLTNKGADAIAGFVGHSESLAA